MKTITRWTKVPSQGCYFRLNEGNLEYSPMKPDGSMEISEDGYDIASASAHTDEDYEGILATISEALGQTVTRDNLDY